MKWRSEPVPAPKNGDVRIKSFFAWRPITIDGLTVWLEFVKVEQRYIDASFDITGVYNFDPDTCWENIKFI